jgi:hypothetical protein
MNIIDYFTQFFDVILFIFHQLDFSQFELYRKEIVAVCTSLIVLILFVYIIQRKKMPDEFIDDGICLTFTFPPFVQKEALLEEILSRIYINFFSNFGNKRYFSLETLIKRDQIQFFVYLPRIAYGAIVDILQNRCGFEIVTKWREKFILTILDENIIHFSLELSDDFIFPLSVPLKKHDFRVSDRLEPEEWMFLQFLVRPTSPRWKNVIKSNIKRIKEGKTLSKSDFGCLGGFLKFVLPFFSFVGNALTFFIHGSSLSEDSKGKNKSEIDHHLLQALRTKIDDEAFECMVKCVIKASTPERKYILSDLFLERVLLEGNEYNSFIVEKYNEKMGENVKNDFLLAHMNKSLIDIVTVKELSSLLVYLLESM